MSLNKLVQTLYPMQFSNEQKNYSALIILGKAIRGVWIQDATNQITSREWSSVFSMNLFGT